ncbi:MAG: SpoVR family protein [Bacteroidota bacterium]|nr:SpoVR family protein [Bacteroidota bacterium]MDP4196532.1 SpoVR family protein [Bacteroidota bacterium]
MKLIDQHTKKIMEGCKERAAQAGLKFDKETLEYMVTNSDLVELSPKNMIPTLYDYWVQDIQVLRGKGEYEYYPNNPYETVINTRPVISFYNNNNPDWLNVMIFYHVIAHIDFFQNNKFFTQTWNYDFKEKALADKRLIARLRSTKRRQVDYIIEFAKGIDNLVGYFDTINGHEESKDFKFSERVEYYFDTFLQKIEKVGMNEFLEEVERFNADSDLTDPVREESFLARIRSRYPEFDNLYEKELKERHSASRHDIMQFILEESRFLNQEENKWMKSVVEVIRDTSLYFSPMIRTKTMNEGWASYWHEKLFVNDERIKGHEVAFAKINAGVTALSKVGLNPYAIGWRLFMFIEEMANKGKLSYDFQRIANIEQRKSFDRKTDLGRDFIFHIRENYCDFTFFNRFVDQDFVDKHKLMVVGQRINQQKGVREYYVKSRKAKDFKQMLFDSLYHPPFLVFKKTDDGTLYLNHHFEGQELYREYIPNTLLGIEYLWGNSVKLETTELDYDAMKRKASGSRDNKQVEPIFQRVIYTMKDRKLLKEKVHESEANYAI